MEAAPSPIMPRPTAAMIATANMMTRIIPKRERTTAVAAPPLS
jgi:hypothetical protein